MNKKISILIIFYLMTAILSLPVFALELDTSVDDEIRRNYNPDKIEEDMQLPSLPKILKDTTVVPVDNNTLQPPAVVQQKSDLQPIKKCNVANKTLKVSKSVKKYNLNSNSQSSYISFKKGKKFKVILKTDISDHTKTGTKVKFVSIYPISTTYFTIPTGTVFNGEIIDSHRPQLSANGGLIKIRINSLVLNDELVPIDAYVTKANYKKIFFNNIKGKRRYLASMGKAITPGRHFFRKMFRVTTSLAQDGSSIIVSPFSLAFGLIVLGGNVVVAPAAALFYKGHSISFPQGSHFEVKLDEDVFIYK